MDQRNMAVLVNVIGAVESGGQVYGRRDYAAYTPPYTNSQIEHTITLGWAQNYGNEGRRLIQMILYRMGETAFREIDKDGSILGMCSHDWETERWNPTDAQRDTLVALITSEEGKECQDELFSMLMEQYISDCAGRYTDDVRAQMMYCEIRHLGGVSAVNRIFDRLGGDYALDSILASLIRDQRDTTSDNQVGDKKFWSRHVRCRSFIEQYAVSEGAQQEGGETMAKGVADRACDWMEACAADSTHGYDQRYRWGERGDYDCSAAVITAYEKAGVPVKARGATYTGNMRPVFVDCGFRDITSQVNLSTGAGLKRGDVLLNITNHTALYCGNGLEVEASINERGTATGGQPGDQTGREFLIRPYRNYPWDCVLRYEGGEETRSEDAEGEQKACYTIGLPEVAKGSKGKAVLFLQRLLRFMGYKDAYGNLLDLDGEFGSMTEYALESYQRDQGLDADGIAGRLTWAALTGL